ncbi:MAG TPA: hypothetical protein VHX38_02250 [Pseudonocardiaceae bacterium]|nr:hypothetical protein [Pseudonocardiaceae bacterium]
MRIPWASLGSHDRFEDDVTELFSGFDDDLEVARLSRMWRDEINANLSETGITLQGSQFVIQESAPADYRSLIEQALADVDVDTLLKRFAKSSGS